MRKIVASVSLVALGAIGVQTVSGQAIEGPSAGKPWNVSATLRGFYDDNFNTAPSDIQPPLEHRSSFGFEVSPTVSLKWVTDQTSISAGYLYSLKYYQYKPEGNADNYDQSQTFNVTLDHAFSERYRLRVSDSFVIGQEPDLLRAGNTFSTFERVSGDNTRNYGVIDFNGELTRLLGFDVGYDNAFYNYADTGATLGAIGNIQPSLAGSLNRIENGAHVEGLWEIVPDTKVIFGYRFRDLDYTGDEPIAGNVLLAPASVVTSDVRNSRLNYLYTGAIHNFQPNLSGTLRAGASYMDPYNDPMTEASWAPYVNASVRYTYGQGSFVEGGLQYDRSATDQVQPDLSGQVTHDQSAAVLFASVTHQITPKLFASLQGQFQNSTFNGGFADGDTEQFYLLGLNAEYRFNRWLSANAGYDYDQLTSDLPNRGYDRNRVYLGVTASY